MTGKSDILPIKNHKTHFTFIRQAIHHLYYLMNLESLSTAIVDN